MSSSHRHRPRSGSGGSSSSSPSSSSPAPHGGGIGVHAHGGHPYQTRSKSSRSATKMSSTTPATTEAKSEGCCPPGTPGAVPSGPYVPKGEDVKLGDLPAYVNGRGSVGIIVAQEIYGINQGRFKEIVDTLANAGYVAVVADYHRGVNFETLGKDWAKVPAWLQGHPWSKISEDLETHIYPLLASRGATKFGVLGFCWGSWFALKAATTSKISAVAYCHPSHTKLFGIYGDVITMAADSKVPVLCYAAGNDGPEVKPGGDDEKALKAKFGDKIEFKEFPEVEHGFVSRLPLDNPKTARDYPIAVKGIIEFFKRTIV